MTRPGPRLGWTLRQGRDFARRLERELNKRRWSGRAELYHIAIGGSVLHRGESKHDLDIIAFARKADRVGAKDVKILRQCMHKLGAYRMVTREELVETWRALGNNETKHVEIYITHDNRRVDLIVVK